MHNTPGSHGLYITYILYILYIVVLYYYIIHTGFQKKAKVEMVYEDVDDDAHKESTPPIGAIESSATYTLSEL